MIGLMLELRGHIAVSGLIGAGKSTLVEGLARKLHGRAFVERVDNNPYFEAFYRDPSAYAFKHFTFFFEQSLTDQRSATQASGCSIQERVIQEHLGVFGAEFFSRGYLSIDDWALLKRLTTTCENLVPAPDLLVHIDISVSEALRRLRHRARGAEAGVDQDYLQALARRYDAFLGSWSGGPIVRLHASEYDFRKESHLETIGRLVAHKLGEADGEGRRVAG
jgi:deoxyadenosine/deoxycytidine kinase